MNITKLVLDETTIAGVREAIFEAIETRDGFDYENGKKTDRKSHVKVDVVSKAYQFEKFTVKVQDTKPVVTNELIAQKGGSVKVKFKNLKGKIYRKQNGEYDVSCTADSVEVIV